MAATLPPQARRWSIAALVTNVGIVVTGGVVRLTGSGLGCSDWPACEGTSVVPPADGGAGWHTWIEFGNRLLTFVVLAACVGAWWVVRRSAAARPRARRLAFLLPVGVLAQAVLGGVTVLTGLHPLTVAAHFLLSAALIGVAVALFDEVVRPGTVPAPRSRRRSVAVLVPTVGAVVLVLGTLLTAAGPHAGDPGTERLPLSISGTARAHGLSVWLTVLATVAVLVLARRAGDRALARGAALLLGLELVQGAVGYWQYFTGIPVALVTVHLLLACLFWAAAVRVGLLATRVRPEQVHGAGAVPDVAAATS